MIYNLKGIIVGIKPVKSTVNGLGRYEITFRDGRDTTTSRTIPGTQNLNYSSLAPMKNRDGLTYMCVEVSYELNGKNQILSIQPRGRIGMLKQDVNRYNW